MRVVPGSDQSVDEASQDGATFHVRPGGCSVSFHLPNVCIGRYVGHVTTEDVVMMFAELQRFARGKPYLFILVDISRAAKMPSETKKLAAQLSKGLVARGTAVVGADLKLRLSLKLVTRAINLINKLPDNPVQCFNSDTEALAWFAGLQARLPPF